MAAASFDAHYDEAGGDLLLSAGDYMYNCQEEIGFDYDDLDLDNNDVPFPPAISEYTKSDSRQPLITFDKAKKTAFKQAVEEVKYFRDKLGHGTKGVDNAFDIMFGEDSELFSKFNVKFGIKSFEVYSRFMATFFIECCLSTNYSKLCSLSLFDNTGQMPPQDFNGLMPVVRAKVAKALERVEYPDEGVNEDEDVATGPSAHIVELLSSTFLKRLKKGKEEGQQSYSSGGHRAEKPFMKQFVDALKRNNDGGKSSIEYLSDFYLSLFCA